MITARADFLRANSANRQAGAAFVLLVRPRDDGDPTMRLGITVTKKVGGAVVRNRIKRRFRALARDLLPRHGIAGADHVLIGRIQAATRGFDQLGQDLARALGKIAR